MLGSFSTSIRSRSTFLSREVQRIRWAGGVAKGSGEQPELLRFSRWSPSGLGVASSLVSSELLDSIRALPEVKIGLEDKNPDHLKRAVDVFQSIQPGSSEHIGSLALLAEVERKQSLLDDLHQLCEGNSESQSLIRLSKAKLDWMDGHFEESKQITLGLIEELDIATGQLSPVVQSARTGLGICRLSSMERIDDAFSVRDPFRQAVAALKRLQASRSMLAMAYLNLGTAEAIYSREVSHYNSVEVPLDSAMVAWRNGLTLLKATKKFPHLQAHLHANMAWGMLQMTREKDYVARASEFSHEALKSINASAHKYGLDRILCLVATCAHKAGDPVTAQGLFTSALDKAKEDGSIQGLLSQREILQRYSELCKAWEKRDSEADELTRQAEAIKFPDGWAEKQFIDGSLWFWFPSSG